MTGEALFRSRWTGAAAAAGVALLCVLLGAAIASGSHRASLFAGIVIGVVIVYLVTELGFASICVWIAIAPFAFPFVRVPTDHPLLTFDRVWIASMALVLAMRWGTAEPIGSRRAKWIAMALAWLGGAYLLRAAFTPVGRTGALETAFDAILLPLVVFAFIWREARSENRIRQLALTLGATGAAIGLLGILEHFLGFELASRTAGKQPFEPLLGTSRVTGPYSVPETYVTILLVCLAATLYWLQVTRRYLIGLSFVALELGGLGFALFRSGWIGALIIIVASLGIRPKRFGRLLAVVGLAGAVVFVAYGQIGTNVGLSQRVNGTKNVFSRIGTYEQGLQLFQDHPVFGVGVNRYQTAVLSVGLTEVNGVKPEPSPHSSLIGQLAEQGLWGTVPLFAVGVATWLAMRTFRRKARGADVILAACVLGGALAYVVMSLTLWILPFGESNTFLAILLGMAAARLGHLSASESGSRPEPANR